MKFLMILLCAVVAVFIGMEATPCSLQKKREMLRNACGHFRRKRGFAHDNNYYKHPKRRHKKKHNHIIHDETMEMLTNDPTDGYWYRSKRSGELYCCHELHLNCTSFTC